MATATPDGGYTALAVDQAASIAAAAHGGQVLVSASTVGLLKNVLPPQAALAARAITYEGLRRSLGLYQLTHPDLQPTFPPLPATPAIPHNLPEVRTSFVGRNEELAALAELVSVSRLVTVVGPGRGRQNSPVPGGGGPAGAPFSRPAPSSATCRPWSTRR